VNWYNERTVIQESMTNIYDFKLTYINESTCMSTLWLCTVLELLWIIVCLFADIIMFCWSNDKHVHA